MPGPTASGTFDVLVIGAGFGGLGAALSLAERGARLCVCESLRYPGGCASTFQRAGFRFDAGATLLSGLGPGQLFGSWLERYAPETQVDWMDPLVELRSDGFRLVVGRDRAALVARFCALPEAPRDKIRSFFARQQAVAAVLWSLFDNLELLPPFGVGNLARHSTRLLRYAPLAPLLGRSLASVLDSHGLSDFAPLRLYTDALCQITVQCSAKEAEALFALAAMDYYYRGTAHVRGGVGTLANVLLAAAGSAGADVRMPARVSALRREADGSWLATTRRGPVRARAIIANLIPEALEALLATQPRHSHGRAELRARSSTFDDSWGAAMLYLVARTPPGSRDDAHHLQLISEPQRPLSEGNHIFVSASSSLETERAPAGRRTLTISTHLPLAKLRSAGSDAGAYVQSVQQGMKRTLQARAPEWFAGIEHEMTASPRTFARFVGRPSGTVGGLPRRVGASSYTGIGPSQVLDGIWLVGDSVFPGQSALATAIGGVRTASAVVRSLGG
jgi:phytoene dehydrogenase-like protein